MTFFTNNSRSDFEFEFDFNSYSKFETKFANYNQAIVGLISYLEKDMTYYHDEYNINVDDNCNIDENNKYYIDVPINNVADLLTNFIIYNDDIEYYLMIQDNNVDFDNKFILLLLSCSDSVPFKLRFIFKNKPFDFKFSFDAYLCQFNLRRNIKNASTIKLSGIKYYLGIPTIDNNN